MGKPRMDYLPKAPPLKNKPWDETVYGYRKPTKEEVKKRTFIPILPYVNPFAHDKIRYVKKVIHHRR